jgi:tetratricopeptide (TPR) repeat protein
LIQEGKLDEAIEVIQQRLQTDGIRGINLSERYYNLLKMRKRYREMTEHGIRHLDLLVEEKKPSKMIQVYAECTKLDPKFLPSAPVLFNIGSWLNETGKTRQSVAVLNRMINAYPAHPLTPKAYFRAAQIFNDRLMSVEKAKRILTVLKQKYPQAEILPQVDNYLANL